MAQPVAISAPDERLSIMVNEEDHLRLQVIRCGLDLTRALAEVDAIDDKLEQGLDFAFSARFGYVTACPTNVGTGIRVSVMLHLPALKLTGEIERVFRAAKEMHLVVRGLYGEGTEATLVLDDVEVTEADLLAGEAAVTLRRHAIVGLCLFGDGVVAGARDLTADYVKGRRQFGRALAEFQAVSAQMADVYIASRTIGLAATSATWRLATVDDLGLDPDDDLAVAAYWFTAEGPKALHTCHHLHGGMGVDVTYPLHTYFSWAKDIARALGGTHQALDAVAAGGRGRG